ncbi:hypothetical protein F2P56_030985, partial [Juglans regia]
MDGDVSLWWDKWSPLEPLGVLSTNISMPRLSIKDCKLDLGWNEELLTNLLGREKALEVLMQLGNSRQGLDKLIWMGNPDGKVSMKNAWEKTRRRAPALSCFNWIWNSCLPKNISMTMWQANHEGLPVDDNLRKVAAPIVSKCVCCESGAYEDMDHVLSRGEVAQYVWRKVGLKLKAAEKWNKVDDAVLMDLGVPIKHKTRKEVRLVGWKKPRDGWYKLNTDGCSLGNPRRLGVGGVIRDEKGDLRLAYAEEIPEGTNNNAELISLLHGLRHCRDMGLQLVEVEMDSNILVNWLRKSICGIWYLEDFWEEIMQLLSSIRYTVQHIYREGNALADSLAKLGAAGSYCRWRNSVDLPTQLKGIYR